MLDLCHIVETSQGRLSDIYACICMCVRYVSERCIYSWELWTLRGVALHTLGRIRAMEDVSDFHCVIIHYYSNMGWLHIFFFILITGKLMNMSNCRDSGVGKKPVWQL